jgi:hypothetical protein
VRLRIGLHAVNQKLRVYNIIRVINIKSFIILNYNIYIIMKILKVNT